MMNINQLEVYKVGGSVRDTLLGLEVVDNDYVVVGSSVAEMLQLGFKQVGRGFPVFLHPVTHEEYALARSETKVATGHLGFSFETSKHVSLAEDLARRDLTINAIAMDKEGKIIDPFGGVNDLKQGVLRHVSRAFIEDPLRVLRVARFAARFNFAIAPDTLVLMREMSETGELNTLTKERMWAEINKALMSTYPKNFFTSLIACHALKIVLSELNEVLTQISAIEAEETLYTLFAAAQLANAPLAQRIAILYYVMSLYLPTMAINKLIKDASINNQCKALAILVVGSYRQLQKLNILLANEILAISTRLDPLRQKERYLEFIKLAYLIANTTNDTNTINNIELLQQIVEGFKMLNYRELTTMAHTQQESMQLVATAKLEIIRQLQAANNTAERQ